MKYPLLLLHGWGFSSRIWQPLIRALHERELEQVYAIDLPGFGSAFHEPCASLERVLDFIAEQLPAQCYLAGWSLGGMLALQLAAREPERIAGVITLGSNPHFTGEDDWPGMPAADYQQFCTRFAAQPQKTWQRFLALQTRGDSEAGKADTLLQMLVDDRDMEVDTAATLLALLGEIDNRGILPTLVMPVLQLLGEQDAITPVAVADLLPRLTAQHTVQVLRGAGHALPVTRTAQVADAIAAFVGEQKAVINKVNIDQSVIDKQRVAASFSRAATSYDRAASLQRDVGAALLATLPETMTGLAVDIGCGTGFIAGRLLQEHPALELLALDFADGMLQAVRQRYPAVHGVRADMEQLPLATQSADWLLSSLALQWATDITHCFAEWRRVLKPGGRLWCSTFLPGTLCELEQCWRAVDDAVHVNRFVDQNTVVAALQAAGFSQVETVQASHVQHYPQLRALAVDLKAIGAHNMNPGQPAGLTGKQRWATLQTAYESLRHERGLPATYEVLYVSAA